MHLRHSVRAPILDEGERILLCRLVIPHPAEPVIIWAAPGGGIEQGETPLAALRRELHEEVGLAIDGTLPHVWHQKVIDPGHTAGHDGVVNGYFLVRTTSFQPRGATSDVQLAAENINGLRWWQLPDIVDYHGPDLFSPRDLATPLPALIAFGLPAKPVRLGL
ncbi:DNA mismatch repair protein MutT [Streptomyces albospinus]|uniref:DNA mismatch repair protein MutT n=1 Tax=Streptomyces albospinus TaxID=285515 RepID=A0ABQ2VSE4_9ACTN|nr:NUDIX domain-containing protein [Streptomyces albospinus]GGV03522.1 DNA mismatch repair protein MutT [Streptomyces albospinus]